MRRLISIALWFHFLLLLGLGWHFAAPNQVAAASRPAAVVQAGHAPGSYQHQALGREDAAVGNEALAVGKELRSAGGSWALPPALAPGLLAYTGLRSLRGPKSHPIIGVPVLRGRLQASIIPNAP
ncbi:hypothetical protein E5K00_09945 [Hymenobacter aquaticus]|uniref:Uncharacterized protein n=1 Tax=Hymenobacter aquaticus TaxID=1867101 RepID=A0A4Z0Q7U9_9BACT|nr:hypothetical protein [Hymenobacter aquaticus]TGE25489.1 hypothetical protein E5K00_09945 [Hymenobacter aquaticus]